MPETPDQWAGRNRQQFLRSTKDALGPEMWFAVKLNVSGTFLFMFGIMLGIGFNARWAYAIMGATFLAFGVSLYWAWYIRRSLNRRWEKELAANAFKAKKLEGEIHRPPDNMLQPKPLRAADMPQIGGPQRGWGEDE